MFAEPDYSAIARYQHARWREIRRHSAELDDRAATAVEKQARDMRAQLGEEKLARIAAYRAWRWSSLARTTEFKENAEWYSAKSQAWQAVKAELDGNGS